MAGGGARGRLLDPAAAEFRPEAAHRFAVLASCHQLHYPFPPLPPPSQVPSVVASRAVAVSMVPRHLGEAEVRAAMEAFGGVQAVDVGALAAEGVVILHYYDLRSAQAVVAAAAAQGLVYLAGGWGWFGGWGLSANHFPAVWAQFAAAAIDEPNQGFIFVLNSDSAFSCTALAQIFGAFGVLKDVKVVPSKQQHLVLVEFYDKRDAGRAMLELNGKEIDGRRLLLQFGATETQTIRSNTLPKEKNREFSLPPRLARGSLKDRRWLQSSTSTPRQLRQVGKPAPCFVNAAKPTAIVSADKWSRKSIRRDDCYVPSPPPPSQEPSTSKRRGNWKKSTKTKEEDSGRFLFKEIDTEASRQLSPGRDSRTTVMIKNIPNKYSQKLLLSLLDDHCVECNKKIRDGKDNEPYSAYDFLYLPIDFNNKCNMGYGFVNLTSPAAAVRLYRAFHRQPWQAFNSRKICQVTYARLQGLEALKEHFRSSRFTCDCDEFMPAVFYPPRDGKQLTEPVPIAGRRAMASEDGNSR